MASNHRGGEAADPFIINNQHNQREVLGSNNSNNNNNHHPHHRSVSAVDVGVVPPGPLPFPAAFSESSVGSYSLRRCFRVWFSCGLLETRFFFTLLSFVIVFLYWAQQEFIGLILLIFIGSLTVAILIRIIVLARYYPQLLYSIPLIDDLSMRRGLLPGQMDLTSALNLNPTHLRLAMMDRDFTPNDYELLLGLDEELRAQQFTGIPQQLIERLPTYTITKANAATPINTSHSSSTASNLFTVGESESDTGIGGESNTTSIGPISEVDTSTICAICLEPKLPGQMVRVLPCLHSFHADTCIDPWLRTSPLCPVDKFRIHL